MTYLAAFSVFMLWGWYKIYTSESFSPSIIYFSAWATGFFGVVLSLALMALEELK